MAYHNIENRPSARVYTDTSQTLMGFGDSATLPMSMVFNPKPGTAGFSFLRPAPFLLQKSTQGIMEEFDALPSVMNPPGAIIGTRQFARGNTTTLNGRLVVPQKGDGFPSLDSSVWGGTVGSGTHYALISRQDVPGIYADTGEAAQSPNGALEMVPSWVITLMPIEDVSKMALVVSSLPKPPDVQILSLPHNDSFTVENLAKYGLPGASVMQDPPAPGTTGGGGGTPSTASAGFPVMDVVKGAVIAACLWVLLKE